MIGVLAGLVVVLVGRPAATWWGGRSVRTRVIVTAPRVADAANGISTPVKNPPFAVRPK